jgi:hypothetical protein
MSMLHIHVHTVCPCPCCMSMLHVHFNVHVHIYRNAEMPYCPASGQSDTGMEKLTIPEQVRYRTKLTQSDICLVRFWTKIRDAGMQVPALVYSMPMPSYLIFLTNVRLKQKTRGLWRVCVMKYFDTKIHTFSNYGLYFGRPLYCIRRI